MSHVPGRRHRFGREFEAGTVFIPELGNETCVPVPIYDVTSLWLLIPHSWLCNKCCPSLYTPPHYESANSGCAAHDPTGGIDERSSVYSLACKLRLQTIAIHSKTGKRMHPQTKGAARRPLSRGTDMQSSRERA